MINEFYFSHDKDARHDPRIKAIESLFKNGYSYFFKTVEYLFGQGGRLEINRFFLSNLKDEIGAKDEDEVKTFIDEATSEEISLFYVEKVNSKRYIRSKSLDKRIRKIKDKSLKARESARARWEKEDDEPEIKPKKKFEDDSDEIRIAKRIYHEFAVRFGAKEPNFQTWAKTVDLILRVDNYSVEHVERTLDAVARHEGSGGFRWGDVIRSPSKLRKHLQSGAVSPKINSRGQASAGAKSKSGKYQNVGVKL